MTDIDDYFVGRYLDDRDGRRAAAPTLADSLQVFSGMAALPGLLGSLQPHCHCLIQGYTAPRNAHALRRFLFAGGVLEAEITAVDLLDLPAIYGRLGLNIPEISFLQGDASDLTDRFGDGLFDVVVQDFILNCAPTVKASALLAEAKRLLGSSGFVLISFTDSSGLADMPAQHLGDVRSCWDLEWDQAATNLAILTARAPNRERIAEALMGCVVYDPDNRQYICVTKPHGRFEFFVPLERTLRQIAEAGLEIVAMATETGSDDNGLVCVRHRCLARAAETDRPVAA